MSYDIHSVVGIDEAGRGALAGPLAVAACLLKCDIKGVKDSKALSGKRGLSFVGKSKQTQATL